VRTEIVYCSHKGNTRQIAEAIGAELSRHGQADVVAVEDAATTVVPDTDLLLVGGPTEGHGMTPEVRAFLDRLDPSSVRGRAAAAFDTRVDWPRLLSGSAAAGIEKELARKGARIVRPAGSFIVDMEPKLHPGELERAADWAREVAAAMEPATV
jgi:flavodoxin